MYTPVYHMLDRVRKKVLPHFNFNLKGKFSKQEAILSFSLLVKIFFYLVCRNINILILIGILSSPIIVKHIHNKKNKKNNKYQFSKNLQMNI